MDGRIFMKVLVDFDMTLDFIEFITTMVGIRTVPAEAPIATLVWSYRMAWDADKE